MILKTTGSAVGHSVSFVNEKTEAQKGQYFKSQRVTKVGAGGVRTEPVSPASVLFEKVSISREGLLGDCSQ